MTMSDKPKTRQVLLTVNAETNDSVVEHSIDLAIVTSDVIHVVCYMLLTSDIFCILVMLFFCFLCIVICYCVVF